MALNSPQWKCELCNFSNSSYHGLCEMCDTPSSVNNKSNHDKSNHNEPYQQQSNYNEAWCLQLEELGLGTRKQCIEACHANPNDFDGAMDYLLKLSVANDDDNKENKEHNTGIQWSNNYGHNDENKMDFIDLEQKEEEKVKQEVSEQWYCELCTMLNHYDLPFCEMCGTIKNTQVMYQHQFLNGFDLAKQIQDEEDQKYHQNISRDKEYALRLQRNFDCAIKAHQKQKDLQSLTKLMAAILNQNVSETKQKGLRDLFKGDAIRNIHILLEKILNSSKLLKYVNEEDVQRTINLIHKYWNTFAESKEFIQRKQKEIDVLFGFCKKWSMILKKRQNLKDGERLSDGDVSFMSNVSKAFSLWFQGEADIDEINKKWISIHKGLKEQHIFWQRKAAEVEDKIKRKMEEEEKSKPKWEWRNIFGSVAKWIGVAAVAVGAIVGIAFSGPIGLGIAVIGAGVGYGGYKLEQHSKTKINETEELMVSLDGTVSNVKFICDAFDAMKKDSSLMEKFFDDFITQLKSPKDDVNEIIEMQQEDEFDIYVIEDNVENMAQSFDKLREIFNKVSVVMDNTIKQEQYGYVTRK